MTASPRPYPIAIKRVYEATTRGDGARILVDRLWPRGLRKVDADIDQWRKDLSPSTELRQFYGHRPERFTEFARRYRAELRRAEGAAAVAEMVAINRRRAVTFLTASRDLEGSEAAVLARHVQALVKRRSRPQQRPRTASGSTTRTPTSKEPTR